MKDHLRNLVKQNPSLNTVREYLQVRLLGMFGEQGLFVHWLFMGGTALRLLFDLPRFSEGLDFALVEPGRDSDLEKALISACRSFTQENYACDVAKLRMEKNVNSGFLRFPGLMRELGLLAHPETILSIKVEVDTKPPPHAGMTATLVRRHIPVRVSHHDRGTLLAGKIAALLGRAWLKGRDLYDIVWYLSDASWPSPNNAYLDAAVRQGVWKGPTITPANWRDLLLSRLMDKDVRAARADVEPFLEREADVSLLTLENLHSLLELEYTIRVWALDNATPDGPRKPGQPTWESMATAPGLRTAMLQAAAQAPVSTGGRQDHAVIVMARHPRLHGGSPKLHWQPDHHYLANGIRQALDMAAEEFRFSA